MSLELTQQEGLDKAYAHYLLFNENSNVLINVIISLELDPKIYIPLLVRRNKEHINKALKTFVINGDYGNFDENKYDDLLKYRSVSDATKLSDDEQTKHAENIDLIHNTVINHYPATEATPDPNHNTILNDARENLNKGLTYYGGVRGVVPKPKTPHQSIEIMNAAIKQATKTSDLKHSAVKHSVVLEPDNSFASSDVDLKLALEVVATASQNPNHKVYGQINTVVSQPEKQATKLSNPNHTVAIAIPVSTADAFHEADDKNIIEYDFITSDNEHIKIPTMDYGATIIIDEKNMFNRCFLLALAHGLGLNEVVFYKKILDLFNADNYDPEEVIEHNNTLLLGTNQHAKQLGDDMRETIPFEFSEFLKNASITTKNGGIVFIGSQKDLTPKIKTELTKHYNDFAPPKFREFLIDNNLETEGIDISYDPTDNADDKEYLGKQIMYNTLKLDIITSGKLIDITEFFKWVYIQEVADRGLVCLILDDNGVIDINNPITLRGEVDKAKTKNLGMTEEQLTKKFKARFDIQNSSVVPIVGNNLSLNSIVLINTNGIHFILGKMTEEMLDTINKVNIDEQGRGRLGNKIININYIRDNEMITIDLSDLRRGGGGFKKTKKRRGYNKRKTCRRKLSK